MSKPPIMTAKKMIKVLLKLGFLLVCQKGSHASYKRQDGKVTTVPMHSGDLSIGVVRQILKDIDLPEEELRKML